VAFSAQDLKDAGFSTDELKLAGFSDLDLKSAGFSARCFKGAGFISAQSLKSAGCSTEDLNGAGLSAPCLKCAGSSAEDLKDDGFSAEDLKLAGFGSEDLKLRLQLTEKPAEVTDQKQQADAGGVMSLAELQDRNVWSKLGVDPTRREMRLSDDEFQKVFGMGKVEWKRVPKWKKDNLKKKHDLF